jgi:hypothetical protein
LKVSKVHKVNIDTVRKKPLAISWSGFCYFIFFVTIYLMQWKVPKNSDKYYWTAHVAEKMRYYGLSEQKILGVIRKPMRIETGIAKDTVAVMLPVGNIKKGIAKPRWGKPIFGNSAINIEDESASSAKVSADTWNQEIWVMYQLKNFKFKISNLKLKTKEINPKIKELQNKISNNKRITIISAWRYPGVSPKNNPIPDEIWREIEQLI